jgi:hypothetical protein
MSAQNSPRAEKGFIPEQLGSGMSGSSRGGVTGNAGGTMVKSMIDAARAPELARIEASKITETDIANQRRARALEANLRGQPVQTIGRGAATLFSPQAGTSATKTLLGQ